MTRKILCFMENFTCYRVTKHIKELQNFEIAYTFLPLKKEKSVPNLLPFCDIERLLLNVDI